MAVREQIYERQLGPGSTAAMPMTSPEAFGAGIGQSMERLGDTMHRAQLRGDEIERKQKADRETSAVGLATAEARLKFDKLIIDQRTAARPDADGHVEGIRTAWDAEQKVLLQGITDQNVMRQAQQHLAEFGARMEAREYEWAEGRRVGKMVNDVGRADDVASNRLQLNPSPEALDEELLAHHAMINGLTGVPADVREKVELDGIQKRLVGYVNGLNEIDPKRALAEIEGGRFNAYLTPQQLDAARRGAKVEIGRLENAEKAELRKAAAQAASAENAIADRVRAGGYVDDRVLAAAEARAAASGDASRVQDYAVLRVRNDTVRRYEPAAAEDVARAIAQIEAVKDWRANPAAVARHDQLGQMLTQKRNAAPQYTSELTPGDPASYALREQQANADASLRRSEVYKPLSDDEVAEYKAQAAGGLQGVMKVAERLGGFKPAFARAAAEQVDSGDGILKRAVALDGTARALIVRGQAAYAANKDVVDKTMVDHAMQRATGAFSDTNDLEVEVRAVVPLIAAALASRAGRPTADKDMIEQAVHLALGGSTGPRGMRLGGLGAWKGRALVLPQGMSQDEFDRRLASLSIQIDAYEGDRLVRPAEMRARYFPVMGGDGLYRFVNANGATLKRRDGSDTELDIRDVRIAARTAPTGPRLMTFKEYIAQGNAGVNYQRYLQTARAKWRAQNAYEGQ